MLPKDNIIKLLNELINSDNKYCADCGIELIDSVWSSVTFGIFICLPCAGIHRKLGENISHVKSISLDLWTEKEYIYMKENGNKKCNETYEKYYKNNPSKPFPGAKYDENSLKIRENFIIEKYINKKYMTDETKNINNTEEKFKSKILSDESSKLIDSFVVIGKGSVIKNIVKNKILKQGDRIMEDISTTMFTPAVIDSYPFDASIPSHVAQFAFPEGLTLSQIFYEPVIFHFVLTNVSGIKVYATTLKFYEELSPFEIASSFFKNKSPLKNDSRDKSSKIEANGIIPLWAEQYLSGEDVSPIYSPKCLILLSYYPFFNKYAEFVKYIYRLSLSPLPIPIERYIVNLVAEIPVPPQGKIQVRVNIGDDDIIICRPPKSDLPLVDFSFRLMFRLLDIENIINVLSLMLHEQKIVLCASKSGLLIHITETLLSLLFPFNWAGAYIPILPTSILDVLDAPIPFLVGVHSSYLSSTNSRPHGVFLVDLEHNRILLPEDENGTSMPIPKLPTKPTNKLRALLNGFSKIFDPLSVEIAKADLAFKNSEYRVALKASIPDDIGVTINISNFDKQNLSLQQSRKSSLSLPQTATKIGKNIAAMTNVMVDKPRDISSTKHQNEIKEESLEFSQNGVRKAVINFFCSLLKRYEEYLPQGQSPRSTDQLFNKDEFLKANSDFNSRAFLDHFLDSQMFQQYCQDKIFRPSTYEIAYFDEFIKSKLNRSKFSKKRIDGECSIDAYKEIFVAPVPSSYDLGTQRAYFEYMRFPQLKKELCGKPRIPKALCRLSEERRQVSCVELHQRIYSLSHLRKQQQPWRTTMQSITKIQSIYRGRKDYIQYHAQRNSVFKLQHWWRSYKIIRYHREKFIKKVKSRILIRRWMVMVLYMKRYRRLRWALKAIKKLLIKLIRDVQKKREQRMAIVIQSIWRMILVCRYFIRLKAAATIIQSYIRAKLSRDKVMKLLQETFLTTSRHIFILWKQHAVPLAYRSLFWKEYKKINLLCTGVWMLELERLLEMNNSKSDKLLSPKRYNLKSTIFPYTLAGMFDEASIAIHEERQAVYKFMKKVMTQNDRFPIYDDFKIDHNAKKKKKHGCQYAME